MRHGNTPHLNHWFTITLQEGGGGAGCSLWGTFYEVMGEDNHMLHQPTAERSEIQTVCWTVVDAKTQTDQQQQVTHGSSHPDTTGRRSGQCSAVGCRWLLLAGFEVTEHVESAAAP